LDTVIVLAYLLTYLLTPACGDRREHTMMMMMRMMVVVMTAMTSMAMTTIMIMINYDHVDDYYYN